MADYKQIRRCFLLKENVLKKFSPLIKKVWLSSPTMHGEELKYMQEAYETN